MKNNREIEGPKYKNKGNKEKKKIKEWACGM